METKRGSYYDFDVEIEEVLIKNGMIADMFYLKDLKQRKLFLNDEINSLTVEDAVKHIMQINREDVGKPYEERTPILVYVNSNGGSVEKQSEMRILRNTGYGRNGNLTAWQNDTLLQMFGTKA